MQLVGVAEIADMLGVSRQRVHQLATREDFPTPLAVLVMGSVWDRAVIEEWIAATGRGPEVEGQEL
jgi:predicted DNA-binding transcriptional regulator AlpA